VLLGTSEKDRKGPSLSHVCVLFPVILHTQFLGSNTLTSLFRWYILFLMWMAHPPHLLIWTHLDRASQLHHVPVRRSTFCGLHDNIRGKFSCWAGIQDGSLLNEGHDSDSHTDCLLCDETWSVFYGGPEHRVRAVRDAVPESEMLFPSPRCCSRVRDAVPESEMIFPSPRCFSRV
jgi:hypothetical protein